LKKIGFILALVLGFAFLSAAQDDWEDDYSDFSTVELEDDIQPAHELIQNQRTNRSFKPNLKSRYKSKDFDYTEQVYTPEPNLGLMNLIGTVLFYLGIVVILIVVLLVIYSLVSDGGISRKGKKQKGMYEIVDETLNFSEIDYFTLIRQAEQAGEYKLAIRYYFLAYLQRLNREKTIEFHPDKTNREYRYEIESSDIRNEFEILSRIFDYCWYGDHDLTDEQFKQAALNFKNKLYG
jgi:hypothetical protein